MPPQKRTSGAKPKTSKPAKALKLEDKHSQAVADSSEHVGLFEEWMNLGHRGPLSF